METAMKVRRCILIKKESICSVAKETGLSRNTIVLMNQQNINEHHPITVQD